MCEFRRVIGDRAEAKSLGLVRYVGPLSQLGRDTYGVYRDKLPRPRPESPDLELEYS